MPTFTSSIPAVTDAFLALLATLSWPGATPQIADSDWGVPDQFREVVIVGDTYGQGFNAQSWAAIGARHREENYSIRVTIKVTTPGLTPQQARYRAFSLLAVIEVGLRSSTRFGLDAGGLDPAIQMPNLEIVQPTHSYPATDEGVMCVIHSGLKVWTRI